jgi:hypothetical protein
MTADANGSARYWWNRVGVRKGERQRYWCEAMAALRENLADLEPHQRDLVRLRWLEGAKRYDREWRSLRRTYYLFRVPTIIGAATVPVLASLTVAKVVTALVGLLVAVLTGLDTFFQLGVRWQQRRKAAILIESAGWLYRESTGPDYKERRTKTPMGRSSRTWNKPSRRVR